MINKFDKNFESCNMIIKKMNILISSELAIRTLCASKCVACQNQEPTR